MKTVVVLLVLFLTLINGAAAGKKSEAKNAEEETCKTACLGDKLQEKTCKEACGLNKRFKDVWIGALQCSLKCNKKLGIGAPAAKTCDGGCKKKYEDKVAEMAVDCFAVCKTEKDPLGFEKCKKICAPSLIYKAMQEKAAQDKAAFQKAEH